MTENAAVFPRTGNVLQAYGKERSLVAALLDEVGITLNGSGENDIQVIDDRFYRRVIADGSLGLGESYVEGWWEVKSLDSFIYQMLRAGLETKSKPWVLIIERLRARLLNLQDRTRCRKVVIEHYNLDNNLYAHMLDRWMQYTSAYWPRAENLDQAQEHKLEQLCQKLEICSSDRVLELGCGFGGFAKFAAEHYGCHVTGYNISKEQVVWAREWTKDLPVDIRLQDYREVQGTFDKIVSVGLCEHVGYKNHRTLMEVAHRSLKTDGLFLLHCIGGNHSTVATDPWLERYIFPGSVMPSSSQITTSIEGLFVIEDWHNFGVDYDKTLMAWFENFQKNWEVIRSTKYNDRFYRMWKYYLLMCAGGFRARKNQNWEIVLSRKGKQGGYLSLR